MNHTQPANVVLKRTRAYTKPSIVCQDRLGTRDKHKHQESVRRTEPRMRARIKGRIVDERRVRGGGEQGLDVEIVQRAGAVA